MGSIYVLALVLRIGAHEAIIQPKMIYFDETFAKYECEADKENLEKSTGIPATCFQMPMGV